MKTTIILKVLIAVPVVLFADYLIMVLFGCATGLFNFGNNFYCGPYCLIGKSVLAFSALLLVYIVSTDIIKLHKKNRNAATAKE
ncbi:MAG: hypothetical protein WC341_16190 [Bacteroidales bacterium]|jgi:uncharacterized membrane protein